jgi:alpha-galactosidase
MIVDKPIKPTAEEMTLTEEWIASNFARDASNPPFSFKYGERTSADFLKDCATEDASEELDECRTRRTLTYTDPHTGLQVRCVAVEYDDFPVVEWTLYFKNTGTSDTPILSDILALDIGLNFGAEENEDEVVLHHFAGGFAEPSAYRPFQTVMQPGTNKRFSGAGGRPTNTEMSYFNFEGRIDEGVILKVE